MKSQISEPGAFERGADSRTGQPDKITLELETLRARIAAEEARPELAQKLAEKKALYFQAKQINEGRRKAWLETAAREEDLRVHLEKARNEHATRPHSFERIELLSSGVTLVSLGRLAKFDEATAALGVFLTTAGARLATASECTRIAKSLHDETTALANELKDEANALYRQLYANTPKQFLPGWGEETEL